MLKDVICIQYELPYIKYIIMMNPEVADFFFFLMKVFINDIMKLKQVFQSW